MKKQVVIYKEGDEIKQLGLPDDITFLQIIDIDKLPDTSYQECWEFDTKGKLFINIEKAKEKRIDELKRRAAMLMVSMREQLNVQLAMDNKEEAKKTATLIDTLSKIDNVISKEIAKLDDLEKIKAYLPKYLNI